MKDCKERIGKCIKLYEEAIAKVKATDNQEVHDFLGRRLYNMTGDIVMSLLLINDASKAPELYAKSARVYTKLAEEEIAGHAAFIQSFTVNDLENWRLISETDI